MLNLKELLKQERQVWFKVEKCDKIKFLKFLKQPDVKWIDGKEINVENDKISSFMGVNENLELGFVSAMCWCSNSKSNATKKYEFKSFIKEDELNV